MRVRLSELRELISEAVRKAYDILGVAPGASEDVVKRAYREKARHLHPDRNAGTDTGDAIKRLNVAYHLLSDPAKRRKYDFVGDKTLGDFDGGLGAPAAPRPAQARDHDDHQRAKAVWDAVRDQAKKAADAHARRQASQTPPTDVSDGTGLVKRYFTFQQGTSNKFWWIMQEGPPDYRRVRVGFGRIGSAGQEKTYSFDRVFDALRFVRTKIDEKRRKGYLEQPSYREQQAPPSSTPKTKAPEPKDVSVPGAGQKSKSTYRIYGKKGSAPVHTRYKGKAYAPTKPTKFRAGDQADVAPGSDGRLSVKDPKSDNVQVWDGV